MGQFNRLFQDAAVENQLAGKIFAQLSTGTPAKARVAAEWAKSIGATYLDGEIMCFPDAVGTDSCAILYSGDRDGFETCDAMVRAFGGTAQMLGTDPGMAAALSNAVLPIYFSYTFGVLNGAAICDAERTRAATEGADARLQPTAWADMSCEQARVWRGTIAQNTSPARMPKRASCA